MDLPLVSALAVAAVAVAIVSLVVVVIRQGRAQRRLADDLVASRREVATLRDEVHSGSRRPTRPERAEGAEFLITSLADEPVASGESPAVAAPPATRSPADVSGQEFVALAVGESVVKAASLAHGLRRAMSAQNRNRIRFEVRREIRRSRRQRRRDLKDARRHLRERGPSAEAAPSRVDAA